jgi:uncharacterized membrane protein
MDSRAFEQAAEEKAQARAERTTPRERETATGRFIKNAASSVGRQLGSTATRSIGNAIIRGILGGLTKRQGRHHAHLYSLDWLVLRSRIRNSPNWRSP